MADSIPALDTKVDPKNVLEGIKEIVKRIRPEWDLSKLEYKDMSTGYINRNYKVYTNDDKNQALFMRLISTHFDKDFLGHYKSTAKFLHEQGLSPKLYCFFENGLCTEFINGETMAWDDRNRLYEDKIWPKAAEALAQYHSKSVYEKAKVNPDIRDRSTANIRESPSMGLLDYVKTLNHLPSNFRDRMPSTEQGMDYIEWFLRTMDKMGARKGFTHMDANPTNIIVQGERVYLVDYDVTGIYYTATDIAWYFLLHSDFRCLDLADYPSDEHQRKWLRHYLKHRRHLDGDDNDVIDADVEALKEEVDIGIIGAHCQAFIGAAAIMCTTQKEGEHRITEQTGLVTWEAAVKKRAELEKQGFL